MIYFQIRSNPEVLGKTWNFGWQSSKTLVLTELITVEMIYFQISSNPEVLGKTWNFGWKSST